MTFAPKPFKIHPYDEMVEFGAPWIDKLTGAVNHIINDYKEAIRLEAISDGEPKLANEDFLYERFLDNRQHNMWKANWQVLKYFYQYFRMKIFYDIIGQWVFTEHDVEMYNYFSTVEVSDADKCKPSNLRFKEKPELLVSYLSERFPDSYIKYTFQYDWWYQFPDRENRANGNYLGLFEQEFNIAELMIRNVKKLTTYNVPYTNFFTAKKFHTDEIQSDHSHDYAELPNRAIDDQSKHSVTEPVKEPSSSDVANDFYEHCLEDQEFCKATVEMFASEIKVDQLFDKVYNSFKHEHKNKLEEVYYLKKQIITRIKYKLQSLLQGADNGRTQEI